MKKFAYFTCAALLLCFSATAWQGKSEEKNANRTLKVKLAFNGQGKLDAQHKIFVFVFDSADFVQGGVMPIASEAAAAKDATVTFDSLTKSPVYIATAYDPKGEYDGQSGPPPSGSSMGIYSTTPGTPAAIEIAPGKTVQVEVAFDDSAKMP